jgi:hypothetical protein
LVQQVKGGPPRTQGDALLGSKTRDGIGDARGFLPLGARMHRDPPIRITPVRGFGNPIEDLVFVRPLAHAPALGNGDAEFVHTPAAGAQDAAIATIRSVQNGSHIRVREHATARRDPPQEGWRAIGGAPAKRDVRRLDHHSVRLGRASARRDITPRRGAGHRDRPRPFSGAATGRHRLNAIKQGVFQVHRAARDELGFILGLPENRRLQVALNCAL